MYICIYYTVYIIFCCPGFIVILGPYGTIFGRGRAGFVSQIGRSWPPVSWRTCEIGQYPSCMVTTQGLDSNWY